MALDRPQINQSNREFLSCYTIMYIYCLNLVNAKIIHILITRLLLGKPSYLLRQQITTNFI